jgi:hypothetical protein
MIFMSNFNKNLYISVIFVAKPKNFVVFAYRNVSKILGLFYVDFCKYLYFVDSGEALNASSLQFL